MIDCCKRSKMVEITKQIPVVVWFCTRRPVLKLMKICVRYFLHFTKRTNYGQYFFSLLKCCFRYQDIQILLILSFLIQRFKILRRS